MGSKVNVIEQLVFELADTDVSANHYSMETHPPDIIGIKL